MDERTLRASLRKAGATKRGQSCPDEQGLAAFADGRLEDSERARVELHLVSCDHCRDQVAFLVRSEGEVGRMAAPTELLAQARNLVADKPAPAFGQGWRWGAAAAVAAALVLAVTLRLERPEPPAPPGAPAPPTVKPSAPAPAPPNDAPADRVVRKTAGKGALPEILFPKEGAVVSPGAADVRWKGIQGAIFYEVQVVTTDGDIVWEGRTEATRAAVPLGKGVKPGGTYFLWVRAHLPDGKTARSAVVSFQTPAP